MGGLLYYVPAFAGVMNREKLAASGFAYAFEERSCSTATCLDGPGGHAGAVFGEDPQARRSPVGFFPDRQVWRRIPGTENYCGFDTEDPPTAVDLQRPHMIPGHPVRTADGQTFIAPVARACAADDQGIVLPRMALPRRSELDDEGQWIPGGPADGYVRAWDVAQRWWDTKALAASEETDRPILEFDDAHDAAIELLSVNYRVRGAEAALLRLLDEDTCVAILDASIDWPEIVRILDKEESKKKAGSPPAENSSLPDGGQAITQGTDPHLPISSA